MPCGLCFSDLKFVRVTKHKKEGLVEEEEEEEQEEGGSNEEKYK
jgi:hypothetical protein